MKKELLLFLLCIFIGFTCEAQSKMNSTFAFKVAKDEINPKETIHVLIQGDVKIIESLVNEVGGKYKFSAGNIASVSITLEQLSKIITNKAIERVEAFTSPVQPLSDSVLCNNDVLPVHAGQAPLTQGYDGTGVIMGFIDTGIDFTHPDFKDALGKSRILWLWDHNKAYVNTPGISGYGYGQEWSNTDIDAGTCTHNPSASNGHGTHVAGIAAGNGLATGGFLGTAPKADIIMVALNFSAPNISDAVKYIYAKAQAAGKPCVINASLGAQAGLHDGRDLESQAIKNLINANTGQAFVAAAGNSGQAGNVHLAYTVSPTDTNFTMFNYIAASNNIRFHVIADSNNLKNIHFSVGADKMAPVHSFRGHVPFVTPASMPFQTWVQNDLIIGGKRLGQVWSYLDKINGDWFLDYEIDPDSTAYNWRLMATGNGSFDLWNYNTTNWSLYPIVSSALPLVATMPDSIYYKFPDADKTISGGFQNLDEVLAVTNYINRTSYTDCNGNPNNLSVVPGQRASSSSIGPSRDGRVKPDIASPGEWTMSAVESSFKSGLISTSQQFKMATGCYHVRSGQTSNACPGVSGIAALYLQKNPTATATQVQQAIVTTAREDSFTGNLLPDKYWGNGKADAFAALTGIKTKDTSICENGNANFRANFSGAAATFQWQVNNGSGFTNLTNTAPYSGATTNTLTITSASIALNGYQYQCIIATPYSCNVYTSIATLTVVPLPTINISSTADTVCFNTSAQTSTLKYSATTSNPITYSIVWDATALGQGFTNLVNAALSAGTISIAVPANAIVTTYTGTITVKNSNTCLSNPGVGFTLTIDAPPTALAGGSQTICENGTATISGASLTNGTPTWTENGVGSISSGVNTLTPVYSAALGDGGNSVTLTMTVTSTNHCAPQTATATYSVIVDALPTATAGGTHAICENNTYTLIGGEASLTNGTPVWTENGFGSISSGVNTLTPTYSPAAGDAGNAVTLTLTVTSNNTCSAATATANYTVNVDALPTATAGGSHTICENTSYTLISGEASLTNGTPAWTENGFGSISSGANSLTPTYSAAAGDGGNTVTLTMTITSTNSCAPLTAITTYSVIVDALPTASAGGSQTICENGTATVSGGGASLTHGTPAWTENGAGSITSGANSLTPIYTAAEGDGGKSVTLTMAVTSVNSCVSPPTAIYTVNVDALPTATAGGNQTICENNPATVNGANFSNGTINWTQDGTGSITSGINTLTPTYTSTAADAGKTVTLTMSVTSTNACAPQTANAIYSVSVTTLPNVSLSGLATGYCFNSSPKTLVGSPTGGTYSGTGITNSSTGIFDPTAAGEGMHTITYTYGNVGCAGTASLTTNVLPEITDVDSCSTFEVKGNVFTPNDDGVNDVFTLNFHGDNSTYSGTSYGKFVMNIFDRWGNVVFKTNSPNVSWDGRTGSGEKVASGTYFYTIEFAGKKHNGFINLIR